MTIGQAGVGGEAALAQAPGASLPRISLGAQVRVIEVVWRRELRIYVRDRARMLSSFTMPLIMMIIFGEGLGNVVGSLAPGVNYREFIFPGILAMSVIMTGMFAGTSVVVDREFGFLREMLVSPASRTAICLGKIMGGGTIAALQSLVLFILAPIIGVDLSPVSALLLFGALFLMALVLTSGGIALGTRLKSVESMQMVGQLIIFPSMFLSGVFFPVNSVPVWMEVLVKINPITYAVALVREAGLRGELTANPLAPEAAGASVRVELFGHTLSTIEELAVVAAFGLVLLALAVRGLQRS